MNEAQRKILVDMYDCCLNEFGKEPGSSLVIQILSSVSNTSKRALISSSYDLDGECSLSVSQLLKEGYLYEIEPGKYVLSAKGILYVERDIYLIGDEELISYLDSKLSIKGKTITDKNRILLLSLFSMRCFSKECAARKNTETDNDFLLRSINDSQSFLEDHGLVKKSASNKKNLSKTPLAQMLNQIDRLPSMSGYLFFGTGGLYYLSLMKEGKLDTSAVALITRVIIGDNPDYTLLSDLKEFCSKAYSEYGFYFHNGVESFEDIIFETELEYGMDEVLI